MESEGRGGSARAAAGAIRGARRGSGGIILVSLILWLFPIGYALYLMLLLDVAMPGHSAETLTGLSALGIALVAAHAALFSLRRRIMSGVSSLVDRQATALLLGFPSDDKIDHGDLDDLRAFWEGRGGSSLIDVVAAPIYIIFLALLGWPLSLLLIAGCSVTAVILVLSQRRMRRHIDLANRAHANREALAGANASHRELLQLVGMTDRLARLEGAVCQHFASHQRSLSDSRAAIYANVAMVIGFTLVSIAALSVWLVIEDRARAGTVAAALLLASFSLLPALSVADQFPSIIPGLGAWRRIRNSLASRRLTAALIPLPAPSDSIEVDGLAFVTPGAPRPLFQGISCKAGAGDIIALLGPAGSGKSALLKMLAGVVLPSAGTVRLDGSSLDQWPDSVRARHIGFLPQTPDLLPGTVAQNIARFDIDADPEEVVRAAVASGAHETIVRLPLGYETKVNDPRTPLPLSTQQRIALARAMFGDPFLLLLDNPAAFQDNDGRAALSRSLAAAQARGAIVFIVGTDPAIIEAANMVLMLRKGGVPDFGTKQEVRERMIERQRLEAEHANSVISAGGDENPATNSPEQVNVD